MPDFITRTCEWCKNSFTFKPNGKKSLKRRFCSMSCSGTWKSSRPEARARSRQAIRRAIEANIGKKRPDTSLRMKMKNPMSDPAVKEKMRQKLIGRPFVERGGNGRPIPKPQAMLASALKLPVEFAVSLKTARRFFSELPSNYKIDIADPVRKVAIEVDGFSHVSLVRKAQDKKKDEVLTYLGWCVVRVTNQRVLNDFDNVLSEINQVRDTREVQK